MKRSRVILTAIVLVALSAVYFVAREKPHPQSNRREVVPDIQIEVEKTNTEPQVNTLNDPIRNSGDTEFQRKVIPGTREFFVKLDRLGLNPLNGAFHPDSCSKIRVTEIPDGIMCQFIIDGRWSAMYTDNPAFSGIVYFGQRGPDDPIKAISHADTNTLRRLSETAVTLPPKEVWRIAASVADAFGINPSKFEKPDIYEEKLFTYNLGIYTVRYRRKGTDPNGA